MECSYFKTVEGKEKDLAALRDTMYNVKFLYKIGRHLSIHAFRVKGILPKTMLFKNIIILLQYTAISLRYTLRHILRLLRKQICRHKSPYGLFFSCIIHQLRF